MRCVQCKSAPCLPASCSCFDTTPRELCAPIIVVKQEYGRRHLERRRFSCMCTHSRNYNYLPLKALYSLSFYRELLVRTLEATFSSMACICMPRLTSVVCVCHCRQGIQRCPLIKTVLANMEMMIIWSKHRSIPPIHCLVAGNAGVNNSRGVWCSNCILHVAALCPTLFDAMYEPR